MGGKKTRGWYITAVIGPCNIVDDRSAPQHPHTCLIHDGLGGAAKTSNRTWENQMW